MTRLTPAAVPPFVPLSKEEPAVTTKPTCREGVAGKESGFALILAILALMLLTFLGLTLATTTSTELTIATNYRWGQQALYNAEAGLEAAKIILSNPPVASTSGLTLVLPTARTTLWSSGDGTAPPLDPAVAQRDYEMGVGPNSPVSCDGRGNGIGYGRVLSDGFGTLFENVSNFAGQTLSGTFTIWVRRGLIAQNGQFREDATDNNTAVVTIEGTAPYVCIDAAPADGVCDNAAVMSANQATRIIETTLTLNRGTGVSSCANLEGQTGMAPQGDNFGCALLDESSVEALRHP